MAAAAGNGSGDRAYSAARSSWGAGSVGSPRERLRARGRVVPRVTRTGRAGVLDTQHRSRVARTGVDEPGCVRGPAVAPRYTPGPKHEGRPGMGLAFLPVSHGSHRFDGIFSFFQLLKMHRDRN